MTCLLLVQPSNPAAPQADPVNALQPALERLGFTLKLRRSAYDHQAAIFTAKTPYADQAAALVPVKEQAAALSAGGDGKRLRRGQQQGGEGEE